MAPQNPNTSPRIALIGIGDAGAHHGRALDKLQRTDEANWIGSVARDPVTYGEFGKKIGSVALPVLFQSVSELLGIHRAKPGGLVDFAIVATPDVVHAEHLTACLEEGVSVLAEKPLTTTVSDAKAAYKTAQKQNLLLRAGYHHRYHEGNRLLKQQFINLGDIEHIELSWSWRDPRREGWRGNKTSESWALTALGTHLIDFATWLTESNLDIKAAKQFPQEGADHSIEVRGILGGRMSLHMQASIDKTEPSKAMFFGRRTSVRCIGTFGARGAGVIETIQKGHVSSIDFTPINPYVSQLRSFIHDYTQGFEIDQSLTDNAVVLEEIKQKTKEVI